MSEASSRLDDLVERVRAGEEFVVERAGEDVLRIGAAEPRRVLAQDLAELLARLPKPDSDFLSEIEAVTRK